MDGLPWLCVTLVNFREFPLPVGIMLPMGLQRYPFPRFGGVNQVLAPFDLDPQESPDLLNVRPTDETLEQLQSRQGLQDRLVSSAGTNPASQINEALVTSTGRLVAGSVDTHVYAAAIGPGAIYWGPWTRTFNNTQPNSNWCLVEAFGQVWGMQRGAGLAGPPMKNLQALPAAAALWAGNPPAQCQSMTLWRGRMVVLSATNQRRILYSDVGNPESPTAGNWGNNFIDIYDKEDSANRAIVVHGENLLLFKASSLILIYDTNTFANRVLADIGTPGFRSCCYCPYDNRVYWYSAADGHIYSSDGNSQGAVCETKKLTPLVNETKASENPDAVKMSFDPRARSIVMSRPTANPNFPNVIELCTDVESPGNHPVYFHRYDQEFTALVADQIKTAATSQAPSFPRRLMGFNTLNFKSIWEVFGNPNGQDGPSTDGLWGPVDISNAYWVSRWNPFISEEPIERLRRLNFVYMGDPRIEVRSGENPSAFWDGTGAFLYDAPDALDYEWERARPETRGRYHQFRVSVQPGNNKFFFISMGEFAFRGGKEH